MRVLCVIPARVGSTRLEEKPLQTLGDEPLIRLVARRAVFLGRADRVVVATDDTRVADAVAGLPGVDALLTASTHRNGTERIAEVVRRAGFDHPVVLNLQGDEPFVPEAAVDGVLAGIRQGAQLATAACPLRGEDVANPSTVKVRVEGTRAVSFSRQLAAHEYLWAPGDTRGWARHLGIYALVRSALLDWVDLPPTTEEATERLEQLRPLQRGRPMWLATIDQPAPPGIDTPDDLAEAHRYLETLREKVGA